MRYPRLTNYIGGTPVPFSGEHLDVVSPVNGSTLTEVPISDGETVSAAASAAKAAFRGWSGLTIRERTQVFHVYRALLQKHFDELSMLIHLENGKTLAESQAEVDKAIEIIEFACSLPALTTGEVLKVSRGVECRVEHAPLGVVASIVPFNFPCMVPHWTIPIAICLGNCMVFKPSEQVPMTVSRMAELLGESGLPNGVFNVVHGGPTVVEAICDEPEVQAISFVGSTKVAKAVYRRAAGNLKRALALGGAKNHLVVLPDAEPSTAATNILGSMAGCAGQRCMAAACMLAVGDIQPIINRLCEQARSMVLGRDLGAVISRSAKERIESYITESEKQGATILVDGRGALCSGNEGGSYVGPTIIDHVRPEMRIAQEEVFGPVLAIMRVSDLDEAIAIENRSQYGNAAAIYTQNGDLADEFIARASAGMIGINVGVPVPREPFGFGGWNDSRFGVGDITGKSSVAFWTQSKKITTRWERIA